jgi:hypothetical protein
MNIQLFPDIRLWSLSVIIFLLPVKYMGISVTKLTVTKEQPFRVMFTIPLGVQVVLVL